MAGDASRPDGAAPPPRPGRPTRAALLLSAALVAVGAAAAHAQFATQHGMHEEPVSKNQPVFYQADGAEYNRDTGIVTLSGHVEIWQGDRDLRADKVTYDRNTGVVAARGHVVILDPNGQVVFGDYAELSQGMKDGIISNLRAQLAQNGHLAANGGRRIDARINELSRVIYSTCDACKQNPSGPLLWDLRARSAVQDLDNKRIEYQDAVVDIYGWPVLYTPYFSQPDPSAKRSTGLLVPAVGDNKYLGAFVEVPYYIVLDDSSDATLTPMLTTKDGAALDGQYRRVFNNGTVTVNASAAYAESSAQGDVFAKGQFAIDDEWRWGFDLQRASSELYMRDYSIEGEPEVLTSQVYLEGFGQGSYTRLDARAYQGLTSNIVAAQLPFVLPRYEYSFVGEPDFLGGQFSMDTGAFNVLRQQGTNTQRVSLSTNWERPVNGALGDLWKFVFHLDSAAYTDHQLDEQPTWGAQNASQTAQAMPTAAVELHWPFERDAGSWGTQIVEPIAQLIAAPNGSSYGLNKSLTAKDTLQTLIPNEDSLDFEFTDATLFNLNRFYGIDRLEGGMRANVALHANWFFPSGQQIDAQIGQGYRTHPDAAFPVGSGLNGTVTDVVGHVTYMPNSWFDITTRERFDHQNFDLRFADAVATGGPSWLRLNVGYIYDTYDPFYYYDQTPTPVLPGPQRDEITLGASTSWGHWHLHGSVQRDLQSSQMVSSTVGGSYEDECFIFNVQYYRRYTSILGDNGDSTLLFQVTFKTVGTFGFSTL